ncbi:WecB/TagA/CpsF family glycosyltransferase [Aquibacillus albus]|uniref:N-acetylglucosaminyldiphosphoundecaprenol N-acetyl-beta-D-mannosaminyltransferase n=1 Tax=Aquibacillus albus TaxID=1168171 RepID=A0ABS2MZV0_9BACI|nr:WecB/TagA/CpsF family glycosyltransferase [Aquibacillus albus]MBM7571366.1 N-acetylglucosaminyldiphosphoundecaprenol N-acetyl-beta-D-mannosaminyltransferase [Aquibacillus albus]
MANKETILGVDVSNETYDSITKQLFYNIEEKKQSFIVAVNPEKIMKASKDPQLRELINSADYQIPDGVGVLIASKLQGGSISNRITGIDLMNALIEEAEKQGKRVFLYGGKPGVAEVAAKRLKETYPNLCLAGILDGYQKDNDKIIDTINDANADLLFVAMGSPRQEEWIRANREQLNVSVFQGVGGSFDVLAGNIKRAPGIFRKFGLEWLYRLIVEPWRWKRQLALPRFLVQVITKK